MPSLPAEFLNSISTCKVPDQAGFEAIHESGEQVTSIRLNPFKPFTPEFELSEAVPWSRFGHYLQERPYFTHDPLFHAGCYYVQEAASMFIEQALVQHADLDAKLKILDLCAAPGGKSTLINSLMNSESLLVANETVKSRADVLAQNLSRWGTCNTVVSNVQPDKFSAMPGYFDVLVVDAPCSGSGLFRKQPEALEEWSIEAVRSCSLRQKSILREGLKALKPGGLLIYSTCSYSIEENEDVLNWLMTEFRMQNLPIQTKPDWAITSSGEGYRFYPHLNRSEGFYCAVLRKTTEDSSPYRNTKPGSGISTGELKILTPFVNHEGLEFLQVNQGFHLCNALVKAFMQNFGSAMYLKKAGTLMGEFKGGQLIPNQELAWSIHLNEAVKHVNLNKEAALQYLKKDIFPFPETDHGLLHIRYRNFGIGWAKLMERRINNYLPAELRILK
ncbi:MAG TPA: hypothetical protein PLQ93_04755 [Bacteroidia bacterium]|nr:hypothetical protein [Bacteroidia bacterium]